MFMKNIWERVISITMLFIVFLIFHSLILFPLDLKRLLFFLFLCLLAFLILLLIYRYNNKINAKLNSYTITKELRFVLIIVFGFILLTGLYFITNYYNNFNISLNDIAKEWHLFMLNTIIEINFINLILAFTVQFIYYIVLLLLYDNKEYPEEKATFGEHFIFLFAVPIIMTIMFILWNK